MCETCGCMLTPGNRHLVAENGSPDRTNDSTTSVEVLTSLLQENNRQAAHNREHFDRHGLLVINLMSAPGSGKTSLLEATIRAIGPRIRIGVIEGDLETENDAERIREQGVPAVQITTGQACHLDAHLVHDALHGMPLGDLDILFIENVGNLVCPASFDLGHHVNVALLSVTEGDDKPAKYPVMFRAADLVVLSKCDLLDVLDDFDTAAAVRHIRSLGNEAATQQVSARRPDSLQPWLDWLDVKLEAVRGGEKITPVIQPDGRRLHEMQVTR